MNTYNFHVNRFGIFVILFTIWQSCTPKKDSIVDREKAERKDSIISKRKLTEKRVIIDSLPVYADVKVRPYTIDSMIAEVTFINNWSQSVWLYKPILPSDTLVENSFVVRIEHDVENVPFIRTVSNHKYLFGDQDFFPTIIPDINENSLLELMPGTRTTFITNLSRLYDFKKLERKKVKAVFIWYSMNFPYIKDRKQILLPDSKDTNSVNPAYLYIGHKDHEDAYYKSIGVRVVLPPPQLVTHEMKTNDNR